MGLGQWLALLVFHPFEFRTLLQFYLYHEQKRDIKALKEHPTSGWDRQSMRRCWDFLDLTSRSFSAVIKELDGDLARTICLFYLVLRGLDTIEDDMTIPDDVKQPILRKFHQLTVQAGWKFDGNGPNEKDRQLLVEYDQVVEELNRLTPEYKNVIIDITHKMENGMADFAHKAATTGVIYLEKISDYDLYCHYVAGLVGEGLSRLFSASGKEAEWLGQELELSNSMGLLLQKTNIIRDYREDTDERRFFWPREIWGKYGFKEMKEMYEPESFERAQWVQSNMVLDALRHATDGLDYLRYLKNQTVFNFCAIPACMAIATLELCFMNPEMFQRNIKIRKAVAAQIANHSLYIKFTQLIMRSTNPRDVGLIFREYARKIHAKAVPSDPNFIHISIACGKIEQWYEQNYPSFIQPPTGVSTEPSLDPADARTTIANLESEFTGELAGLKRMIEFAKGDRKLAMSRIEVVKANGKFSVKTKGSSQNGVAGGEGQVSMGKMMIYVSAAFTLLIALGFGAAYGVIWIAGDSLALANGRSMEVGMKSKGPAERLGHQHRLSCLWTTTMPDDKPLFEGASEYLTVVDDTFVFKRCPNESSGDPEVTTDDGSAETSSSSSAVTYGSHEDDCDFGADISLVLFADKLDVKLEMRHERFLNFMKQSLHLRGNENTVFFQEPQDVEPGDVGYITTRGTFVPLLNVAKLRFNTSRPLTVPFQIPDNIWNGTTLFEEVQACNCLSMHNMFIKGKGPREASYHIALKPGQPRFMFDAPDGLDLKVLAGHWQSLVDWVQNNHGREIYQLVEAHKGWMPVDGRLFIVQSTLSTQLYKKSAHYFRSRPHDLDLPLQNPYSHPEDVIEVSLPKVVQNHTSLLDWNPAHHVTRAQWPSPCQIEMSTYDVYDGSGPATVFARLHALCRGQ
ncbi:hypothetical protein NP233_g8145 [Leucocoprinus birnbaumii]|uniref:squalene synthase n=1 Tax=Leucocoprinus birnbaumii TaxID=56174 RepID=A0AAD5VRD4_9AGAR|nr:hypothetical protein NP233_g8145 [Leucocoprinus birnbaumii]